MIKTQQDSPRQIAIFPIIAMTFLIVAFPFNLSAQMAPGASNPVATSSTNGNTAISSSVCPEPKSALGNTPDDLADIQSDITRFTLCVQRAQLLERLNSLALQNIDTIDSALDFQIQTDSADLMMMMENLTASSMPAAVPAMGNDNIARGVDVMPRATPESQKTTWAIQKISGNGQNLMATLVDDDGQIVTVKSGDKPRNHDIHITSITNTSVTIKSDGKTHALPWDN
jgi:type IV pilus biogenesis protein PilP